MLAQVNLFLDDTLHLKYAKYRCQTLKRSRSSTSSGKGDTTKGLKSAAICIRNIGKTGAYSYQLIIQITLKQFQILSCN